MINGVEFPVTWNSVSTWTVTLASGGGSQRVDDFGLRRKWKFCSRQHGQHYDYLHGRDGTAAGSIWSSMKSCIIPPRPTRRLSRSITSPTPSRSICPDLNCTGRISLSRAARSLPRTDFWWLPETRRLLWHVWEFDSAGGCLQREAAKLRRNVQARQTGRHAGAGFGD